MMVLKQDKGVQTDRCLSLEIGDKILEETSTCTVKSKSSWWKKLFTFY